MKIRLLSIIIVVFLPLCHISAQDNDADTEQVSDTTKNLKEKIREKKEQIIENLQEKKDKIAGQIQETKQELKIKGEDAMIKADSALTVRNSKITTDTFYVARPIETWTFRAKGDAFADVMHLRAVNAGGNEGNYYLSSDPKITLGMMANYRGISASISLSPSKILNEISDMVSAINYYNNTFGVDLTFEKVDAFRGRTSLGGKRHKLHNTNMRSLAVNGYYVFNGKRFSLPAVFNSTWIQKRSAGSFLVQAAFATGRLKIGDNLDDQRIYKYDINRIDMNSFSLGAGYGYNLVAGKHWLFHATLQPSVMIWRNYNLHTTDDNGTEETNKMEGNLNIFLVGRAGVIYSWDRYFIGATSVVQHSKTGKDSDFSLRDTQWQVRAFFGWRMHTKLHQQKKATRHHRSTATRK